MTIIIIIVIILNYEILSAYKVFRVPDILASHNEGHKAGMMVNRVSSEMKRDILKSEAEKKYKESQSKCVLECVTPSLGPLSFKYYYSYFWNVILFIRFFIYLDIHFDLIYIKMYFFSIISIVLICTWQIWEVTPAGIGAFIYLFHLEILWVNNFSDTLLPF